MVDFVRIGLLLATVTLVTLMVQNVEADEGKKKRVIIKIPTRIKHVYHHHTKKIHIHKKKPKPKPASIHVVHVEEEVKVEPIKSWKAIQWKAKGHGGGGRGRGKKSKKSNWQKGHDWVPKGFAAASEESHSFEEYGGEGSSTEEDYHTWAGGEDDYGKGFGGWHTEEFGNLGGKTRKGKRGTVRGHVRGNKKLKGFGEGAYDYEDAYNEGTHLTEDKRRPNWQRPLGPQEFKQPKVNRQRTRERGNQYKVNNNKAKNEDIYIGLEDYEDVHERDSVWPERKEHPSWHQRKQNKNWMSLPAPKVKEEIIDEPLNYDLDEGSYNPKNDDFKPSASISDSKWLLPPPSAPQQSPTVYPSASAYTPDSVYTSAPVVVPARQNSARPPAGSGYHSQISHSTDGKSVGYRSHIGHSSDVNKPSSSFQSVRFGDVVKQRR